MTAFDLTSINWVARNPEKYSRRLQHEFLRLQESFPLFRMKIEDGEMWAEGSHITISRNLYRLRAYYPMTYPHDKIIVCAMDQDIVNFCMEQGPHEAHNFGQHPSGGIMLCMFGPGECGIHSTRLLPYCRLPPSGFMSSK